MRRCWAALAAVALTLGLAMLPAAAQVEEDSSTPQLTIQELRAEPDGTTRATILVTGLGLDEEVSLNQLEIVENGVVVEDLRLASSETEASGSVVPGVVIAIDVSGSTEGPPLDSAKAAAADLAQRITDRGGRVGVVSFSEGTETVAPLSDDADGAVRGITSLAAGGNTALYDGVARAARILTAHDGPRDVIVFSDGEDTASLSTLDDVRALLAGTEVRVTSVVLRSENFTTAPLAAMADVNGGSLIEVDQAEDLAAAFQSIAGDLSNRLDVVWVAAQAVTPEPSLNVVATYSVGGVTASDGAQIDNPRIPAITPPREIEPAPPIVDGLATDAGLTLASIATGAALFLLLLVALIGVGESRRRRAIDDRLAAYQPGIGERGRDDRTSLSERASSAFDAIPRPKNLDSRVAAEIEHADWPLRVSEFFLISLGVALLGFLIGTVLLGTIVVGLLGGLLGLGLPWIYLKNAVARRRAEFADQLPTVLQVLAGALRAGHAFSTALENAVDEVDEPAKGELRRASVEARLGRPLDRALKGVADRMDSTDLQWVIGALEVQREVGGNLAEILTNVAGTLRDRASITRHVKALTAEGRLSAAFISAMPFVMFAYLSVTNPDYVNVLFTDPLGRIMLVVGLVLLVIGVIVLRRLIRPKY